MRNNVNLKTVWRNDEDDDADRLSRNNHTEWEKEHKEQPAL